MQDCATSKRSKHVASEGNDNLTEVLLFLPNEVLRDFCWINSKHRRYIILISDIPTKSDGNMVSGAICGYHALKREFLFGEYQTVVSLDQLESVT